MPENASLPVEAVEAEKKDELSVSQSYDINKFKLTKVLSNNTSRKLIALLGTFPDISETDEAVLLFEKQPFSESDVQTPEVVLEGSGDPGATNGNNLTIFSNNFTIKTELINDIYGNFQCNPDDKLNCFKAMVVYPATDKHIAKYSLCKKYLIHETPSLYENVTLPYLKSAQFSIDWVFNILEHKQETERIVFEDSDPEKGFILIPDMKWDGQNPDTLYLLAIIHKRDIKSLRDLTIDHVPILKNIRDQASRIIYEKFGLNHTELRMYLHYQPSFYHLHVHINPLRNDAPGIFCEKSHMLGTVIDNLEICPDYYKNATLPFVLYEGMALLEKYDEDNSVRKKVVTEEAENSKI